MRKIQPIETGGYYHIYNCGINGINLFTTHDNYRYFMQLYNKYIDAIAETFAWCLMPNHFHAMLKIKDDDEIVARYNNNTPERVSNPFGDKNEDASAYKEKIRKHVTQQFSNLFNSYAQALNKRNNRHGSLFEKPFKRKLINNERYFTNLITYINNNPVHHGFVDHAMEWGWSSYLTCLTDKTTKLNRHEVIQWFNGTENFKYMHNVRSHDNNLGTMFTLE